MSNQSFELDTKRPTPALNYLNWIHRARKSGKSLSAMLREIVSLQFGRGKLTPEEYFLYELYDDNRYTPEAKRTFIHCLRAGAESPWAFVANDKPTLTAILRGLDFPIPETQAIAHPTRTFAGAQALRNPDDMRKFLREGAEYPIFGKPYDSVCSLGTSNISEFDYRKDALVMSDGRTVELDPFVEQVKKLGWKYLFQTRMQTHPALVPIVGERVCTVRMFVLSDYDDGCELLRAAWKIPASENGADNFWRRGNILAGIDVETGRVVRSLRRTEDGTEPVSEHPLTGASLENLVFPEWESMRDVVLRAAPNFPECHFQGWDVALTDRGPVLVELEGDGGDPIMEQICFDSGLLQGRFLAFLDKYKKVNKERVAEWKAKRMSRLKRDLAALSTGGQAASDAASSSTDSSDSSDSADQPKANPATSPQAGSEAEKAEETVTS